MSLVHFQNQLKIEKTAQPHDFMYFKSPHHIFFIFVFSLALLTLSLLPVLLSVLYSIAFLSRTCLKMLEITYRRWVPMLDNFAQKSYKICSFHRHWIYQKRGGSHSGVGGNTKATTFVKPTVGIDEEHIEEVPCRA
jgi:hypothetical protein